jgi:hypothetical protein
MTAGVTKDTLTSLAMDMSHGTDTSRAMAGGGRSRGDRRHLRVSGVLKGGAAGQLYAEGRYFVL